MIRLFSKKEKILYFSFLLFENISIYLQNGSKWIQVVIGVHLKFEFEKGFGFVL
jgi:hypothetical protein